MGRPDSAPEARPERVVDRRVTLRGADRTYTLNLDTNAQCRIEAATGLPSYGAVLDAIRQGNVSVLRTWVHEGLIDPPDQSLEQVGAIIDDVGGMEMFTASITKAKKGKRRRG